VYLDRRIVFAHIFVSVLDFEQDGLTLTFTLAAKDQSSFVTLTIPDACMLCYMLLLFSDFSVGCSCLLCLDPDEGTFKCYDSHGERNLGSASIKRMYV
jgi:hypothetical protein